MKKITGMLVVVVLTASCASKPEANSAGAREAAVIALAVVTNPVGFVIGKTTQVIISKAVEAAVEAEVKKKTEELAAQNKLIAETQASEVEKQIIQDHQPRMRTYWRGYQKEHNLSDLEMRKVKDDLIMQYNGMAERGELTVHQCEVAKLANCLYE